jgi:hypothetical protein
MKESSFSRITLVTVTGLANAERAADALILSQKNMPGARALLCCPNAPANLPAGIEYRAIAPLNYHEYSWFMMFALWKLIDTEFALVVQDDGWVLDGASWREEFFDYDYIGAPINHARVDTPDGVKWINRFGWYNYLKSPQHTVWPVFNGGFSLRSRRLMRAFHDHPHIRVELPPPDVIGGDPLVMRWTSGVPNEDVQLSVISRPELEAAGLRYAPLDVCCRFAAEDTGPMFNNADFMQLFGHHARWRRLVSIDPPTVRYSFTRSRIEQSRREMDMARMLEARGYRVIFEAE